MQYFLNKFSDRQHSSAVILHGAKDMGWSDQFTKSLALEYKNKIDFMSVVDDEGRDP